MGMRAEMESSILPLSSFEELGFFKESSAERIFLIIKELPLKEKSMHFDGDDSETVSRI